MTVLQPMAVNTSSSTAVSNTFELQKPNPVLRTREGRMCHSLLFSFLCFDGAKISTRFIRSRHPCLLRSIAAASEEPGQNARLNIVHEYLREYLRLLIKFSEYHRLTGNCQARGERLKNPFAGLL